MKNFEKDSKMFEFSRLLLGGSTLASSAGLSAYFAPQLSDLSKNTIYKQDFSNDSDIDYRKLKTFANESLKELEKLVSEFKTAKNVATKDKEEKYQTSLELMSKVATSEETLQKLYEHIKEKLESFGRESKALTETIQRRLEIDSKFQQIKVSQGALNQLVQRLQEWESQMNKVVCAFKQQGNDQKAGTCDPKVSTVLSTVINASGSSGGANQAGSKVQSTSSETAQTEGKKAQETLAAAQTVFESLQQSIKSTNLSVQQESLKMIWEEIKNYPEWLKLHSKINLLEIHIQLINRNIKTTNTEAFNKVDEINKTNEELVMTYNKYNNLKKWESSLHNFIQQFQKKMLEFKGDLNRTVVNSLDETV